MFTDEFFGGRDAGAGCDRRRAGAERRCERGARSDGARRQPRRSPGDPSRGLTPGRGRRSRRNRPSRQNRACPGGFEFAGRPDFVDCVEFVDFVGRAGTRGGAMLNGECRRARAIGRAKRATTVAAPARFAAQARRDGTMVNPVRGGGSRERWRRNSRCRG